MTFEQLEPVIGLRGKGGADIGDDRIRLLEAIDAYGSLSAAARNVGLTYKAVWDAVAAINDLAERPWWSGASVVGQVAAHHSPKTAGDSSARYSSCNTSCVGSPSVSVPSLATTSCYPLCHGDS
jgi:hypothetical protein